MGLREIREKNRHKTSLTGSKIKNTLSKEGAEEVRKFFKEVVEPTNNESLSEYQKKTVGREGTI